MRAPGLEAARIGPECVRGRGKSKGFHPLDSLAAPGLGAAFTGWRFSFSFCCWSKSSKDPLWELPLCKYNCPVCSKCYFLLFSPYFLPYRSVSPFSPLQSPGFPPSTGNSPANFLFPNLSFISLCLIPVSYLYPFNNVLGTCFLTYP